MDRSDDCPTTYEVLIRTIDVDLMLLDAASTDAGAVIAELDVAQAGLGYHPNYAAYEHGGIAVGRRMGAAHIPAHAGFYLLPYGEAIDRLAAVRVDHAEDDCLLTRLRVVCESDPLLEIAGLAWLGDCGLLKNGNIDPFWIKRPALGLGQPAKLHRLGHEHREGHRGIYTLSLAELRRCFSAAACEQESDTFGALLRIVIEAGGLVLAAAGEAVIERDANDRYNENCRRFAEHQRTDGNRRWRWKPPFSRQGHLAVTTARAQDTEIPAEQTRGHAATWLDDHGANIRFRKD